MKSNDHSFLVLCLKSGLASVFSVVLLVVFSGALHAQIVGPTAVETGSQHTYTYNGSPTLQTPVWYVTGGTKVTSTSMSVTIRWSGSPTIGMVKLQDKYTLVDIIGVQISSRPPAPSVVNGERCDTGSVTLTASTTVAGATLQWYSVASGGYVIHTGTNYSTSALATTTSYWVAAKNDAGLEGPRTKVTATIHPRPTPPETVQKTYSRCGTGSLSVEIKVTSGDPAYDYAWYATETAPTPFAHSGLVFNTSSISSNTSYYISRTEFGGSCESSRSRVDLVIKTVPVNTPVASSAQRCGPGSVTLSASGATYYRWYDAATGGSLLSSNSTLVTSSLTETTTFYVALAEVGCEGPRVEALATINDVPSAPSTTGQSLCGGGTFSLAASGAPVGGDYQWYTSSSGGAAIHTGASYAPTKSTTTTFWVSAASASGCESTRASVGAVVLPKPTPPFVGEEGSCDPRSFTLEALQPLGTDYEYRWFSSPTTPTVIGTGLFYHTPVISTSTSYFVSSYDGSCESDRREFPAIIYPPSDIQAAGQGVARYGAGYVTLRAENGPYGYQWYDAPAVGSLLGNGENLTSSVSENRSFYVTALSATGCPGPRTAIQAEVIPTEDIYFQFEGGQMIPLGGSILLSVSGQHDEYQWSRDGWAIPGATNSSLTVVQGGVYQVRLTPGGNVTGRYTTDGVGFAQDYSLIRGAGVSYVAQTETYTYVAADSIFTASPRWSVTNGSILETFRSDDQRKVSVTILWNNPGTGVISLSKDGAYINSKAVLVTAECEATSIPDLPLGQKHHFVSEGGSVTVALTSEPGTVIQWFDLDLIYTTLIHEGTSFAVSNVTNPRTLAVRSYDPANHCASRMVQVQISPIGEKAEQRAIVEQVRINGVKSRDQLASLTPDQKNTFISFLDGLGRQQQKIMVKGSPQGYDIVEAVQYGADGRISRWYLPYVSDGTTGTYQPDFVVAQSNFYNNFGDKIADDSVPYRTSVVENSPLGRVVKAGDAGTAWQPESGHASMLSYTFNDANEVRLFKEDGSSETFYLANTLNKTVTADADGNQFVVFTDLRGRTLLKKQQLDETVEGENVAFLETYYIYDQLDRLKYIISPKGVSALKDTGWSLTESIKNGYAYQFVYDPRGRLVEKKVPGQAPMYYVYDALDRLVLIQNYHLRRASKWIFTKYDNKDRAIMQGLYTNAVDTSRAVVQGLVDNLYTAANIQYPKGNEREHRGTVLEGYTNISFPKANQDGTTLELWNVLYFDDYDFNFDGIADYEYASQGLEGELSQGSSKGLATGSKHRILGTSTWLTSYAFYDEYRRLIQTRSNNHKHLVLDNIITAVYDDEGKLKITKNHHFAELDNITTVVNRFTYDDKGRLLEIYQNNNNASSDQLVVKYEYNELGQVVDKKLHKMADGAFLQSVDLRYNIRGWLTSINNAALDENGVNNDDPDAVAQDYFGMEFLYDLNESGLNSTPRFNGNISAVKWAAIGYGTTGEHQSSYSYLYDKANRLKVAASRVTEGGAWTKEIGALNESLDYDHNGNVRRLQRNDRVYEGIDESDVIYNSRKVDDLAYSYDEVVGDRLLKVADAVSDAYSASGFDNGSSGIGLDYAYDQQGNLLFDHNRGIDSIYYNLLGKPWKIEFAGGKTVTYTYDVVGIKLSMTTCSGTTCDTVDYVNGFVYKNDTLRFFASPEGRVVNKNGALEYQYVIADQQGNTRVLLSSSPEDESSTATFELNSGDDVLDFLNVDPNKMQTFFAANHTASGGKVIEMDSTYRIGPAKSLKVYPGDKIDIEVWEYHEGSSGFGTTVSPNSVLINVLATAFGGVSDGVGEAGAIYNGVKEALTIFGMGGNQGDSRPAAYLNFILFDKNYNLLDAGFQLAPEATFSVQKMSFPTLNVEQEGYVFVYLSYDNDSPNRVFFDDFRVAHTKTHVIQYNEYYPYGLQTSNSWTREQSENNFLYNGGTERNASSGYYDLFYRNYDPAIGRFIQVDPMAVTEMATYQYSGNNPVLFNDPLGDQYNWKKIQWEARASEFFRESARRGGGGSFGWNTNPSYDGQIPGYPGWMGRQGRGSGNHWADGIGYSDWTPNGGSQMYRDGLASGLTDIGGELYAPTGNGLALAEERNGRLSIQCYACGDLAYQDEAGNNYYYNTYSVVGGEAQQGGPGGEYALNSAFTMRGDDVNYRTLYNEFLTGRGPEYSGFGANHPMTKDLKNSWIVGIAQAEFLKRNLDNIKNNRSLQPLRMFDVPFGLVGAGMSGTNMTEQFIGGARISIIPTGSSLLYIVNNTTGAYSYNLHSTPDIPRASGALTPQGTIYQRFMWTTP